MLYVHQSNRAEVLAADLARLVRTAPLAPFEPETILVGASGTARWLSFVLADALGIAANLRFPFPASYVWSLISRVVPDVPESSPLEPETLKWRIAAVLARVASDAGHARLARYLADGDPMKAYQLAERLATVFDRYLVYRPDWLEAWGRGHLAGLGPDEPWQAALWREVVAGLPESARRHPRERFLAAIDGDAAARAALPERLHLFAIDALPPLYLDTFRRIAAHRDVHLWHVNPCREYWPLIDDPRRVARARAAGGTGGHRETGNRLLASLGRHGRALVDAVVDDPGGSEGEFRDPATAGFTLLAALQSDILALRERGDEGAPLLVSAGRDGSFAVHVCHSPMREVEVLHDQLLDRFAHDPTLRPADVLVLVPDIARYAPIVDAVFGTAPGNRHIPYGIADLSPGAGSEAMRALGLLLALPDGRLEAEAMLALIESPPIARRFGLDAADASTLREWARAAGIHWGRDETTRERLGLPAARAHSWRAGLERLFLGYAALGDGQSLFAETLPVDAVEGGDALLLARFARLAETVFDAEARLAERRPLSAWRDAIAAVIDALLAPSEEEVGDVMAIRDALDRLARHAAEARHTERLPLPVVAAHLQSVLARTPRSQAFLGGGVTFASLAPARPIPARLVCLVGMNDGAYPRESRPPAFDLVGRFPRRGDRVMRDEERYAFLDAVLSAREALYVSYTGRSVRDAKPLPPSPLVAELLDAARRAHIPDVRAGAMRVLVTEHPLQPFSERYVPEDAVRFTYADEYARRAPVPEAPRFAGRRLAPAEPLSAVVTLGELARFLANPARSFLERRLGLRLEGADAPIEAAEPFALDALAGYAADQRAFALRRAGQTPDEVRRILRAAGLLPDGPPGEVAFTQRLADLEPIVETLRAADFVAPVEAELDLGSVRLAVRLDQLTPAGRIAWRAGRLRAQDRLQAWVAHLALAALAPAGVACRTRLVTRTESVVLNAPRAPLDTLRSLLALRTEGDREPLPFFPDSALAYASAARTNDPRAMQMAERAWEKEREDVYFSLAFNDARALDERFAALALEVFGPVLDAEAGDA